MCEIDSVECSKSQDVTTKNINPSPNTYHQNVKQTALSELTGFNTLTSWIERPSYKMFNNIIIAVTTLPMNKY